MNILVACSTPTHRADIARALNGHQVEFVESGAAALSLLARKGPLPPPALLIVDGAAAPGPDFALLEQITSRNPHTSVVLLAGTATADVLLGAMRAGIREVVQMPLVAGTLGAAIERLVAKRPADSARKAGKILAFIGCKGGSGVTFLATNLACQLGETSSVLVIDLDLQFGDALSLAHDGKPAMTIADVARDIGRLDASLLAASCVRITPGCSILAAPEDPAAAADITPAHIDAILSVAISQYDFVVLDLGRALNPVSIKALDCAYRIYPVLEARLGAIRNACKLLAAFTALGYPSQKIECLLNRFESRSDITPDDILRTLGTVPLRQIPNSYKEVSMSILQGDLLASTARTSAVVRKLTDLCHSLVPPAPEQRGIVHRLLRRA